MTQKILQLVPCWGSLKLQVLQKFAVRTAPRWPSRTRIGAANMPKPRALRLRGIGYLGSLDRLLLAFVRRAVFGLIALADRVERRTDRRQGLNH